MSKREDDFYLPSYVNIELTNHCNMRCIICPHGHNLVKDKGYMEFDVYKKIIDELWECKEFNPDRVNLVGVGESLLHPQFIDMANYLKKTNYVRDLVTNAYFLTPDKSDEIIVTEALDIIEISFDTMKEEFEKFKGGKIYQTVMNNIEYFIKKNKKIQVRIVFIQYDMEMENLIISQELKSKFSSPLVFFTGFNVSSWRGTLELSFLSDEARKKVEQKLRDTPVNKKCSNGANLGMFSWDGTLRSCYLDYNRQHIFGNVKDSNTIDLLLSDERKQFVDNIYDGKPWENFICKDCLSPYNAANQELVLETANERIKAEGSMWEVMKEMKYLQKKDH